MGYYKSIKDYKFLGWANGWKETPKELEQCKQNKHVKSDKVTLSGQTTVFCSECKIYYKIDSSD